MINALVVGVTGQDSWSSRIEDRLITHGMVVSATPLEGDMTISMEVTRSSSREQIDPSTSSPLPEVKGEVDSLRLAIDYMVDESLTLGVSYQKERSQQESPYQVEGDPTGIPGLLTTAVGDDGDSRLLLGELSWKF
jgi:hypothetical protein